MKVFISWSGRVSHKLAIELRDWLPSVIQSIEPYVSSEDIDKGARWATDIAGALDQSAFGILCVTRDNMEAPWLNFEAGALSKSIDKGNVCPFLFGVERSEVQGPLLQFQSTICEKEDVLKLVKSLNLSCQAEGIGIDEKRLEDTFDIWWPRLQEKLDDISSEQKPGNPTVVIVDDEEMVTMSLGALFVLETGIDVLTFNSPIEALEKLQNEEVDLVISDYLMVPMNGIDFLVEFKRIRPEAIRILLTAYADLENAIRGINEVGLYQFIQKPWDNDSILILVKNALSKALLLSKAKQARRREKRGGMADARKEN